MAHTYTKIHIHIVFSVRKSICRIPDDLREELHRYITGIVQNQGHKMLAVNSMPDHIHIFIGLKPDVSLSSLVRDIKANSSRWIHEHNSAARQFEWQRGYGAFSYAHSQVDAVVRYVRDQQKHHQRVVFREEYLTFLQKFGVSYDLKYVFEDATE